MLTPAQEQQLITAALSARQQAYAPYSQFSVGAAIWTARGQIISGCNVENASYGLTICAERVAIGTMVAGGEQQPVAIAIATRGGGSPCGACRQVLSEFAPTLPILLIDTETQQVTRTDLGQLLPRQFERANLSAKTPPTHG
jgi:cytidine deaminase